MWAEKMDRISECSSSSSTGLKSNKSERTAERTTDQLTDSSLDCLLLNPAVMAQTQETQRLIKNLIANFFMPASWNESVQNKKVGLPPFLRLQPSKNYFFNIFVFLTSFFSSNLKLKPIHVFTQR